MFFVHHLVQLGVSPLLYLYLVSVNLYLNMFLIRFAILASTGFSLLMSSINFSAELTGSTTG